MVSGRLFALGVTTLMLMAATATAQVCNNPRPLGMESGDIPDSSITANTWREGFPPWNARLNLKGAWSQEVPLGLTTQISPWLQVDLLEVKHITEVKTQGFRHANNAWVTTYKLQYSTDGTIWTTYADGGSDKVFTGNTDWLTPVTNMLNNPVEARHVRFLPQTWVGWMTMRVEIIGCSSSGNPPQSSCILGYKKSSAGTCNACRNPLGMGSGSISYTSIKASSFRHDSAPQMARLNSIVGIGAWVPMANDNRPWLQVDLGASVHVTGVIAQGQVGSNARATTYKLRYSTDENNWQYCKNSGGSDKIFLGFYATSLLENPVEARYVRFYPQSGHGGVIAMRVEILGCDADECLVNNGGCDHVCTNTVGGFQCSCNHGYTSSDNGKTCRKPAICSASGDPHYYPFDGGAHHFQGPCRYTFAEHCHSGNPVDFTVEAQNRPGVHNSAVSYVREVYVKAFGKEIGILQGKMVEEDGQERTLPLRLQLQDGEIRVSLSGRSVLVSLMPLGVEVSYDGYQSVKVTVPGRYFNQMCGLCGNYNGNPSDNFMRRGGMVVDDENEFGDSWLAPLSTCSQVGRRKRRALPTCDAAVQTAAEAPDSCGFLNDTSGAFGVCHGALSPDDFLYSCVFDMCALNGDDAVLCQNLEAYADACVAAGVAPFSWRTEQRCPPDCSSNSTYSTCTSACPATCANPNAPDQCTRACVSGCACDVGFILSGLECVPEQQCGCTDDEGRYFMLGERWIQDGADCVCETGYNITCVPVPCDEDQGYRWVNRDGVMGCRCVNDSCAVCNETCDENASCRLVDWEGSCVCDDGFQGDGVTCGDATTTPPNERATAGATVAEASFFLLSVFWILAIFADPK